MKTLTTYILFILVLTYQTGFSQTQWVKYPGNPVMVKQNTTTELITIGQPTILLENDTLKMWYLGAGLPWISDYILYAYSTDGISWTKYDGGNPVMNPSFANSYDAWLDTPGIFRDANGYKLYYFGDTALPVNSIPSAAGVLCVATSPDGINWTRYAANPILTHGNPGDWDQHWIESPEVLYDSITGQYFMWFSGVDTNFWRVQIGLATSPDGLNWTKYPGNPVLTVGASGSYDDMMIFQSSVLRKGNLYEMWYNTLSSANGWDSIYIAYAFSTDGINWIKYAGNPLFSNAPLPVDSAKPWAPDVVFDVNNNAYLMLYETPQGMYLATSPLTVGTNGLNNYSREISY